VRARGSGDFEVQVAFDGPPGATLRREVTLGLR
jgi:hypothetical protein